MSPVLQLEKREILIPSASIQASITPASFDPKTRTFELVFYAGGIFQRYNWSRDEVYECQLDLSASACDLSRLNSGKAPFLLDHNSYSVKTGVAGIIESAKLEPTRGTARVRMSGRPDLAPIVQDVQDGILCNCSVGTDVFEWREITAMDAKIRRFLATSWKPYETSLVSIPADEGAVVLSRDQIQNGEKAPKTHRCTVFFSKEVMDELETETETTGTPPAGNVTGSGGAPAAKGGKTGKGKPAPKVAAAAVALADDDEAPDAVELAAQATATERTRITEIQRLGLKLGLDPKAITKLVASKDHTLDQARAEMIELAAAKDDKGAGGGQIEITREANAGARLAMETYLLHRHNPTLNKISDQARAYVGLTILDLAKECLDAKGVKYRGESRQRVVELALQSTSDFPELLANVAKKTLQVGFMNYPSQWQDFCRIVPAADFKQISSISLGDSPKLKKTTEHGEFKRGKIVESAEKYSLETYGEIVGFTRQAMVNDDLDALTRIPQMLGAGAAALVADVVFAILTANANMADGVALFHATHKNLGVKTLTLDGLTEMRSAMRVQTGPNGQQINVQPKKIVVPAALETAALQLLAKEISPTQTSNANVFKGMMDPIIEPRLDAASATVWYGAADPQQMDGIQVSFLEGEGNGPRLDTRVGFEVDGVDIKVVMDVAAKAVQFRGLWKSAGTTP